MLHYVYSSLIYNSSNDQCLISSRQYQGCMNLISCMISILYERCVANFVNRYYKLVLLSSQEEWQEVKLFVSLWVQHYHQLLWRYIGLGNEDFVWWKLALPALSSLECHSCSITTLWFKLGYWVEGFHLIYSKYFHFNSHLIPFSFPSSSHSLQFGKKIPK